MYGIQVFKGYLGDDESEWKNWDATELVKQYNGPALTFLIDQGSADPWLEDQLKPKKFVTAAAEAKVPAILNMRDGYDHGYFFVGTFINEHLKHHSQILNA